MEIQHFVSNTSERVLYSNIDLMLDDIENAIHPNLTRSNFVALYFLLNNMIGVSATFFYTSVLVVMFYRSSTFGRCDKLIILYLGYQIFTFGSSVLLQKMSFRVGTLEYYAIQTYHMFPTWITNILEHILKMQYVLFWYISSALLIFRMLTFSVESSAKIEKMFFMCFIPLSAFVMIIFYYGSTTQMELMMLTVMFVIWCTHRRHMVAYLYSQGVSRRDIMNSKRLNAMYSTQLFSTIFFYFVKYGSFYVVKSTLTSTYQENLYIFYADQFFNTMLSFGSITNACLFFWATKDHFNSKAKSSTNVLPITASYNLTAGNFSRRPSTISAYSINASPLASITPINPNMLHV